MSGAAPMRAGLAVAVLLAGAGIAADAGKAPPPPAKAGQVPANPRMAAQLPDLAVTNAYVGPMNTGSNVFEPLPPEGASLGQQVRLGCFFTNRGRSFSGSLRVRHFVDGKMIIVSGLMPGLDHGASTGHLIFFTPAGEGSHRYECAVAYESPDAEAATGNNRLGRDFLVHGPPSMTPRDRPGPRVPAPPGPAPRVSNVDLTVPQIFALDGFWSVDWQVIGVAKITVTVKNVGMEAAPSREWKWQWVVDGVPRACAAIDPRFGRDTDNSAQFALQPGESRSSTFWFRGVSDDDLAALKLGFVKTYKVKVLFNCDFAQPERDGDDNSSREIPVWFKARTGVPGY